MKSHLGREHEPYHSNYIIFEFIGKILFIVLYIYKFFMQWVVCKNDVMFEFTELLQFVQS